MSEPRLFRSAHARGFTLLEVIVVIAVLTILVSGVAPLVGRQVERARERRVSKDLDRLSRELEEFFYEEARFPSQLDESLFADGFASDGIEDPWGARYRYNRDAQNRWVRLSTSGPPTSKTTLQETQVTSERAGRRRTRDRLGTIQVALNAFVAAGGELTGNWVGQDRSALSLGTEFDRDGWGRVFVSQASPRSVVSVGFDGQPDTDDDLGF